MNEQLMKFKEELVNSGILQRTPTNREQFRTQVCPRCGDAKYHTYVKVSFTNDDPVVWHCFKCNASGIVNQEWLNAHELDIQAPTNIKYQKRLTVNDTPTTKLLDVSVKENHDITRVSEYIHSRVGHIPTLQELQAFQYVGDPVTYANDYLGGYYNYGDRCWFLLSNGTMIGRTYHDTDKQRWIRFKTNRVRHRGLYTMKTPIDLYQSINIVIAEGVMDVIGLYYLHPYDNAFYIGTLGSEYAFGLQYMIKRGIFGNSVNIHIFKDEDVANQNIMIDKRTKRLFKHIDVYENLNGKDYGILPNQIELHRTLKIK